jgi:four helix bundle protein
MGVDSHRDLIVWKKAIELVVSCYRITATFPRTEQYGLTSQLQRAAVSIPANIAEGKGRASTGAYLNHLSIAAGSLAELDTHLVVGRKLGLLSDTALEEIQRQLEEVGRMLTGLRKSLE